MNKKKIVLALLTLVILLVFALLQFQAKDPRVGFDKPEGYFDYFKQITVPIGQEISGYKPNYSIQEFKKAQSRRKPSLKAASNYTWVQRGPGNVGGRTRAVIIDPDDPTGKTWFVGSVSGGIWKTTDAGRNWDNLTPDLPNLSTATLVMGTSNTNILYAGTGEGYGGEGMVSGNGIYISTDKGANWDTIGSTVGDEHFRFVNKLWVSPTNDSILIAATNRGIFKTKNRGATWDSVFVQGYAVQDIVQNPLDENVLYAGVNKMGVVKSYEQGDSGTWIPSYNGMGELNRVSVTISPVDTSYLFAGAEGPGNQTHIYQSRDAGRTWHLNRNSDGLYINFHKEQGWFNNLVAAHPFEKSKVFVGGVHLGLLEFGSGTYTGIREVLRVDTVGTAKFMHFNRFGGSAFRGALNTGVDEGIYDLDDFQEMEDFVSVEIRFDTNLSQMAHRFSIPEGEGAGVPADKYFYEDYVEIPFQVWDVDNNKQLMVSFRDQDNDGEFNLTERAYGDEISGREYIYIHAVEYNSGEAFFEIAQNGGYEYKQLYFLWPILPEDMVWSEDSITKASLNIKFAGRDYRDAYTTILADDNLNEDLHVDHHDMKFFIPDSEVDSFVIVEANDGGLGYSADMGKTWKQINENYLTTQFYGIAKRPGKHEYIGGLQDNGTWQSPLNQDANESSKYEFRIEGDGFEALWHPWYSQRILASSYNNFIKISNDFGETWEWVDNDILGTGPFITKLSHSRNNPDLVFAVGPKGVYRHTNFGFGISEWQTIDLGDNWTTNNIVNSSHHVKVSKANPAIVWAGAAMYQEPDLNIFLSKDYGKTFDTVNNYLDEEMDFISGMATHPKNPAEAFVLFSLKGKPKVLRTMDFGESWTDISGFANNNSDTSSNGFPDVIVNDLLVMPHDTNIIWVATEIGLFESTNNGESWSYSNGGLPAVSIWQMDIVDGQVILATHGRGVWTADLGYSPTKEIKKNNIEIDLYPNPARDEVNISVNSEFAYGSIYLFNLSGKKILTQEFDSEQSKSGIVLDISFIPTGNYILLMRSGSNEVARKLMIR